MRKSASDFSTVGENKIKNKQVAPGHLLPKPVTASVLFFFVKCWSYKWTPLCVSGIAQVQTWQGKGGQAEIS